MARELGSGTSTAVKLTMAPWPPETSGPARSWRKINLEGSNGSPSKLPSLTGQAANSSGAVACRPVESTVAEKKAQGPEVLVPPFIGLEFRLREYEAL
jgi:hypothetical protein